VQFPTCGQTGGVCWGMLFSGEMEMPAAYPEEARPRAVSLVIDEGVAAVRVAKDLGTAESESGLRLWVDVTWSRRTRSPG
jgi:transposase-like protein